MAKRIEVVKLPYGEGTIELSLPEKNLLEVLEPKPVPAVEDAAAAFEESLNHPAGLPPLEDLIAEEKPSSALVLLSDHTRIVPEYPAMLAALLKRCLKAGLPAEKIRLLIAGGSHRPPTCEERERLYGKETLDTHQLYSHNAELDCIPLGALSTGHPLDVNRLLLTHDLVIATGKITPHYLAGYSGGRKAVLPGCASLRSIAANHAMVARRQSAPGVTRGNPVHEEMDEAAAKTGIGFIVNVVPTPEGRVAGVYAGHWRQAFEQGTVRCREAWAARFGRPADCVIAAAGGHPADIDLYQIQRVLNNVAPAVKPGGTIVLVGRCGEGVGQSGFGGWMARYSVPEILAMPEPAITAEAHRAYSTALVLDRCEVCVVSGMDRAELAGMKFRGFSRPDEALGYLAGKHGPDFGCYLVPQGYATMLEGDGG